MDSRQMSKQLGFSTESTAWVMHMGEEGVEGGEGGLRTKKKRNNNKSNNNNTTATTE